MSKQQLTELLIKNEKPYQKKEQLWFNRYNSVVDVYHSNLTQSPDGNRPILLEKISCESKRNLFLSYMINNYLMNIFMVLTFTFLPLFNLGLLFVIVLYLRAVKKETDKHKRNMAKVQDPFQNFYFYPEMCKQLEKHFTTLNLSVEEIQNFKFNDSSDKIRQNLLSRQQPQLQGSGQKVVSNIAQQKKKVKVPIYDQYFYDSFFLVRKQYYKALSWVILGIFLIGLDIMFYYGIFEDFLVDSQ